MTNDKNLDTLLPLIDVINQALTSDRPKKKITIDDQNKFKYSSLLAQEIFKKLSSYTVDLNNPLFSTNEIFDRKSMEPLTEKYPRQLIFLKSDIQKTFGCTDDETPIFIRAATGELMSKIFHIPNYKDLRSKRSYCMFTWITNTHYLDDAGILKLTINDSAMPYLTIFANMLKNGYSCHGKNLDSLQKLITQK